MKVFQGYLSAPIPHNYALTPLETDSPVPPEHTLTK